MSNTLANLTADLTECGIDHQSDFLDTADGYVIVTTARGAYIVNDTVDSLVTEFYVTDDDDFSTTTYIAPVSYTLSYLIRHSREDRA